MNRFRTCSQINHVQDKDRCGGATRNPEFRGRRTFLRIFSGRAGESYFGSVRVGYFLPGYGTLFTFSRDYGDKLEN